MREIAHFVRCIPVHAYEHDPSLPKLDEVWASPDVVHTMGVGQPHDHALLMACMFRACKFEDYEDAKNEFKERQAEKNRVASENMQELVDLGKKESKKREIRLTRAPNKKDKKDEDLEETK